MNARINEIGRDDGHVYGLRVVVCTNAETVCSRFGPDESGNGWKEEADEIETATWQAIEGAFGGRFICDTESNFAAWNGGKYSHQASTYGYFSGPGLSAVKFYMAEIDSDEGDGEFEGCSLSDFPPALQERVISAMANAGYKIDAVVADIDAAV